MFRLEEKPKRKPVEIKRGYVSGRLTVLRLERITNGKKFYRCRCECTGRHHVVERRYLVSREARSCGCLRVEVKRAEMQQRAASAAA